MIIRIASTTPRLNSVGFDFGFLPFLAFFLADQEVVQMADNGGLVFHVPLILTDESEKFMVLGSDHLILEGSVHIPASDTKYPR